MTVTSSPSASLFSGRSPLSHAVLIQWGMAIVTLVLVAAPLGPILWQSLLDRPLYEAGALLTGVNYTRLFGDPDFHDVLVNSFELAFLSTLVACGAGVAFALFLERTNLPGRGLLRSLILWPMYISQLVTAFAWYVVYGPAGYFTLLGEQWIGVPPWDMYSIPGMAIVAGATQAPLVYLFCSSSARMADATLEDAGRSMGASALRVLWSISLPLMRPAIIYSGLLVFIGSLEMLAIPLVFGRPAGLEFFTSFLYSKGLGAITPDYGMVGAAAAFLLLLVSGLLVLQGLLLRKANRFITVRGKAQRPKLADLGKAGWPVAALLGLYILLCVIIPLAGIVMRAFTSFLTPLLSPMKLLTTDNFTILFAYPAYVRAITNSVVIALVGGVVATAFVAVLALVIQRSDFPFRRQLEFVALYPRAMPGIVAGIGFFWAMLLLPGASLLQGTIWILMIAFTMRGIPTAYGALAPALMQIGRELDQSARSAGAGWWTVSTRIILPLMKPALFSAFTLLFLGALKEYASAVFLFAPGSEIIGTTMLSFWSNGNTGAVAALSVIQLLITVFFVTAARFITRTHRDV